MAERDRSLRDQIRRSMLDSKSKLPVSPLSRIGRTLATALHSLALDRNEPLRNAAALAAIVESAGQLKGVAMKVGQIISYIDVAVPNELREALSVLQTHSPPMPFERVQEIVTRELGDHAHALLENMDRTPVAAASIGQVHRAVLGDGRRVAVKVQYPEIEAAIRSDFRPAAVGTNLVSLLYPGANVKALVAEARERFLAECDYLAEAASQARFAAIYEGHPMISIPSVLHAYCTRRVLTSAWIEGRSLDEFLERDPSRAERDDLGEALFEFYIGTLFRHGLYNCDPHPGNYLVQDDGRLALLDYGCTRQFEAPFVAKLAALSSAVHSDDTVALHEAFVALGMVQEGRSYDFASARELVRGFYGPMSRDECLAIDAREARTLRSIVADKRKLLKLSLPGEFLFLFRIRFGLMSVLAKLGARANWYRLERSYFRETAGE